MKHDPKDYPTPIELAKIAAPLAAGKRSAQYSDAAKSALELWKACAAELEHAQIESELTQAVQNADDELYGFLDKDSYTLNELLKLAFPKVPTIGERTAKFRNFLNDHLRGLRATELNVPFEATPTVSLEDKNNYLEKLRENGLTRDKCKILILRLGRWKKQKSKERASNAATVKAKRTKK